MRARAPVAVEYVVTFAQGVAQLLLDSADFLENSDNAPLGWDLGAQWQATHGFSCMMHGSPFTGANGMRGWWIYR